MRAWHRRSRRQPPVMSENETGWIISIKVHPPVCSSALTPCQGRNSCAPAEQFDDPPLHFCPQEQHTRHVFNLQTVFLMFSPPPPKKMVEFPFRHEFELFSYSFIRCKVFLFYFVSARGLYFFVCVFPRCINTILHCVTSCLFDDSRAFSSLKKHFAATLHDDKSYPAACSAWRKNKDSLFCRFFFFFFFPNFFSAGWAYAYAYFFVVAALRHSRFLFALEMSTSDFKYSSCCNILLTWFNRKSTYLKRINDLDEGTIGKIQHLN